jgi:hypothetical protein
LALWFLAFFFQNLRPMFSYQDLQRQVSRPPLQTVVFWNWFSAWTLARNVSGSAWPCLSHLLC